MNLAARLAAWSAPVSFGLLALLLAWETVHPFFGFYSKDPHRLRGRLLHGVTNLGFGLLNGLAIRFVFLALWVRTMQWTDAQGFGVLHWLSAPEWLRWALALLLLDAWTYWWHRLNHSVPFFWRFHRLHHSDRQMDVTTANRFHLGEMIMSSLLRVPVLALIGCRLEQFALYELLLFAVVQFQHANIGLAERLDRALRWVIVTPHMHKVHHSVVRTEQNSNFSSLFSWWDRLALSLRLSRDPRTIAFGLNPAGVETESNPAYSAGRGL